VYRESAVAVYALHKKAARVVRQKRAPLERVDHAWAHGNRDDVFCVIPLVRWFP